MNLKILIVEDDMSFAIHLTMLIDQIGYETMSVVDTAKKAFDLIKSEQPDIILMDIGLNGDISGLDLANMIQHFNIPILFITNYTDESSYKSAQETTAIGYLVKPVDELTLRSAIEMALKKIDETKAQKDSFATVRHFFIKKNKKLIKVDIDHIFYIESSRNYCTIYSKIGKFLLRKSLAKLFLKLPQNDFIRIHKSYVVRVDKISSLSMAENFLIVNGVTLPIGKAFKNDILDRLDVLG